MVWLNVAEMVVLLISVVCLGVLDAVRCLWQTKGATESGGARARRARCSSRKKIGADGRTDRWTLRERPVYQPVRGMEPIR